MSDKKFIDISKMQQDSLQAGMSNNKQLQKAIKETKKAFKDCKSFTFSPNGKEDIKKILRYLRDRDSDMQATVPKNILVSAS